MGYLFPGLLLLFFVFYILDDKFNVHDIFHFKSFVDAIKAKDDMISLNSSVLMIVLGYVVGHFISYLSSMTVEYQFKSTFGYPSRFLLNEKKSKYKDLLKSNFTTKAESSNNKVLWIKTILKLLLKISINVLIIPITLTNLTIGYLFDINGFITRPLDGFLRKSIRLKLQMLADKISISKPSVNEECDYHRVIMHYVYTHIPTSQKKIDNYIALYGFLRCISLIFCLSFDALLFYTITTIDFSCSIDYDIISELCILYVMAYLSFLAFVKFYRRATLEDFMTLLIGI